MGDVRNEQQIISDTVTLGELSRELGPRFAAIEAAAVLAAVERWPLSDIMPVKRSTATAGHGEVHEVGYVRAGGGPIVNAAGEMPIHYASFEAMAFDGWRPD